MSLDREIGEIKVTVQNIERLLIIQNGRIAKAESSLDSLRTWQSKLIGAGTAFGALVGGGFAAFWDKLSQ